MKTNFLQKLQSRKLWACLIGVAVGIAAMTGFECDTVCTVAGAAMSVASALTYIITEGRIDRASVQKALDAASAAVTEILSACGQAGEAQKAGEAEDGAQGECSDACGRDKS